MIFSLQIYDINILYDMQSIIFEIFANKCILATKYIANR